MSKKEKKVEDNNEVLVPEENASFLKRLASPGYLLLHPEKTKKALSAISCTYWLAGRLQDISQLKLQPLSHWQAKRRKIKWR